MEINEILQGFQQRYEKTYIFVTPPDSNEESLFHVDRVTADPNKIANLSLSSPEFGKIVLNMGTAHSLKFKYPPVGVFQHGADAQIFRRRPAKQYKRGLCIGNSVYYPVYQHMMTGSRDRAETLPFDVVIAAFAAEKYSFKDALTMLSKGRHRSVALRDNFSLMLTPNKGESHYLLLYWETPVAMINKQTGEAIHFYEDSFKPVIDTVKGR